MITVTVIVYTLTIVALGLCVLNLVIAAYLHSNTAEAHAIGWVIAAALIWMAGK